MKVKEFDNLKKSYYAIIPANVRYNNNICANAKLLYGEITALCNEKGYCWASNNYFSKLYNVSKVSISKWINQLKNENFINIKIEYKKNNKQILNRYITILNTPIKEKLNTPIKEKLNTPIKEKLNTPIKEKFKENNTLINNTINNKKNSGLKPTRGINSSNFSKKNINKKLNKNNTSINYKELNNFYKKLIIKFEKKIKELHPRIKKEKLRENKELKKIKEFLDYLLNNTSNKFLKINKEWAKNYNLDFFKINKKFSKKEIEDLFNNALKIYEKNYWPDNKNNLPTRLSLFFYNPYTNIVSYFFKFGINPPKQEKTINPIKDDFPKMTNFYEEKYFEKKLPVKEKNKLIKECKKIRELYNDLTEREIELKNGKKYKMIKLYPEIIHTPLLSLNSFCKAHLEWLNIHLESYKNPHINKMKCTNGFFNSFIDWFEKIYGIDIWKLLDDEKIIRYGNAKLKNEKL
jgi:hypothetical protein